MLEHHSSSPVRHKLIFFKSFQIPFSPSFFYYICLCSYKFAVCFSQDECGVPHLLVEMVLWLLLPQSLAQTVPNHCLYRTPQTPNLFLFHLRSYLIFSPNIRLQCFTLHMSRPTCQNQLLNYLRDMILICLFGNFPRCDRQIFKICNSAHHIGTRLPTQWW